MTSEHSPEQITTSASHETAGQQVTNSPSSTIPLEGSFAGPDHERRSQSNDAVRAGTVPHPIVINDSGDDRLTRSPSRPRRVRADLDYSYQGFMDVMDDATIGPSHRRKRKRGLVTGDMEDVTSSLVSTLYLFSHLPLTIRRTTHMKNFDVSTVH
jgi:hypothetical protein